MQTFRMKWCSYSSQPWGWNRVSTEPCFIHTEDTCVLKVRTITQNNQTKSKKFGNTYRYQAKCIVNTTSVYTIGLLK